MTDKRTGTDPLADVGALLANGKNGTTTYLGTKDVHAGPLTFGIAKVEIEHFPAKGDKKAERKLVLSLAGDPPRKLSLNQTNLQTLTDAWGTDARNWVGQVFDAYCDRTVRDPSGKVTGGLRVRVRPPVVEVNGSGAADADDLADVPF